MTAISNFDIPGSHWAVARKAPESPLRALQPGLFVTGQKKMKAPVQASRRIPAERKTVRGYSHFIYKTHKEAHPAGMKNPDFLASRHLSFPRPLLLRLVSSEAYRLSRSNRLKIITLQEIDAAVTLVQKRIRSRAAA